MQLASHANTPWDHGARRDWRLKVVDHRGASGRRSPAWERLPFPGDAFDACRIERVLQHVRSPAAVLNEVWRVLRADGGVAVLEPDWCSLTFEAADATTSAAVTAGVALAIRQPAIGRQLRRLLVDTGFSRVHVAVDTATYPTLADVEAVLSSRPGAIGRAAARAVTAGLVPATAARSWLDE